MKPYKLSALSLERLSTCDVRLQKIILAVAEMGCPLFVLCGHRNEQDQQAAYSAGYSKLEFPNSKHNKSPSQAVDIETAASPGKTLLNRLYLAGAVVAYSYALGTPVRYGGDFNGNYDTSDDKFMDSYHFELLPQASESGPHIKAP